MEPGQGIWLWVGIGFLTIGVGILLWNLFRLTDSTAFPENRWKYLYGVVYSCYPMGVGCKAALLGPDFVRFHLSDVGFPAVLALIIFRHFWGGYSKDNDHLRQQHWTEQALTYVRYRKNVLIVALILSILYEWATGIFWAVMGDKPSLIGGFDWWDVACYGVSDDVLPTKSGGARLVLSGLTRRREGEERLVNWARKRPFAFKEDATHYRRD